LKQPSKHKPTPESLQQIEFSFLFPPVLQQTTFFFVGLATFSDGGNLSTKYIAVSQSSIGIYDVLPSQGGSKTFLLLETIL
jgi:hypothetical protein